MNSMVEIKKDDKTISYNTKNILHYLNADEVTGGAKGYCGNTLKDIERAVFENNVVTLSDVYDINQSAFRFEVSFEDDEPRVYPLFLPIGVVKTSGPILKPFNNIVAFCLGLEVKVGDVLYIREKGAKDSEKFPYRFVKLNGFRCPSPRVLFVELGAEVINAERLFEHFEYSKDFRYWKPFGVRTK